jgi:hypothetical protein
MAERGRPKIRIEDLVKKGLWPENWKEIILQMGREGAQHTHIMERFDLARDTFYALINRDKDFCDTVKKAQTFAQNYWMKFMEDAFKNGDSKSINSNLWSLVMRNRFKEDWSEKQYIDHSTNGEKITSNDIVVKIIPPKNDEEKDINGITNH